MNMRHLYTKDRVSAVNLDIQHYLFEQMTENYLEKPLQGELFQQFQELISNVQHGWR